MIEAVDGLKFQRLGEQGYVGTNNDRWRQALSAALGVSDDSTVQTLEALFLDSEGVSDGPLNSRWYHWLGLRGFSYPDLNSRWWHFWHDDGALTGGNDWTIGNIGTLYGYRPADHPTNTFGDLVPDTFEDVRVWELTVDTSNNLVVLDMGAGGGQQPNGRLAYDLDIEGYGRIRVHWNTPNLRYDLTDSALTTYVAGQSGNTLQVRVWAEAAPLAPLNFTATEADLSGDVVLDWTPVNPLDEDYSVERDGVPDVLVSTSPPPIHDTSFTAGFLHTYRVRLKNPYGTGPYSAPDTGWAGAPAAAPSSVAAADGYDAVTVTWTDLLADYVVTQYRVEWATSGAGPWNLLTTVSPGVQTAQDTAIAVGATRHYRVLAVNSVGNGTPSLTDSATRLTLGAPAILTASDGTVAGGVSLTWTPVAGAHGYRVRREDVQIAQTGGSPYLDTTAGTGQTYSYTVRAYTATQESDDSPSDTGWHGPPSLAPTNVAATENDPDKVVITWTDLPAGHVVDSYIVSAATQSGGPYDRVVDSVAPGVQTVSDFGLNPAESAWYVVTANNGQGNGPDSAEAKGTRYVAPPGQPSTMWASNNKVGVIDLSWEHPVMPGADSYNVYRRLSPSGQWEQIATGVTIP